MSGAPGHVFVVHGRLENLACDAVAVPTDAGFHGLGRWTAVVGDRPGRPDGWGSGPRWGTSGGRTWFVDVGRRAGDGVDELVETVEGVLRAMAAQRRRPSTRAGGQERALPLLALPVVGIGRGGYAAERGDVVAGLLAAAARVASDLGVDVAFVTDDAAVHGALQHVRMRVAEERGSWSLPADLEPLARELARRARDGGLALFLGAGVSIPAGLPTWDRLVGVLRDRAGLLKAELSGLTVLDQAELLRHRMGTAFGEAVARKCSATRHALGHALLADLGCAEVVTTNFDQCFEIAADAVQRPEGARRVVLPWSLPAGRGPWLLKLHGDVGHPGSIVLSRRDFVRYDAVSRPAASVLQALLLTRHLLVVGASLSDDNVLRLAHEVGAFREQHGLRGAYGTVLDVEPAGVRGELWDGELTWHSLPGADVAQRARMVEVFLDVVAARATTDASWLLDERFASLLPAEEQRLAADLRDLRGRMPARQPWASLRGELDDRGAVVRRGLITRDG